MPAHGHVLVLVDLQNDFCDPSGACARAGQDVMSVQKMLPAVMDLIGVAHECGVPTVFLRVVHGAWFDTAAWRRRGAGGGSLNAEETPVTVEGSWGAEFCQVVPGPDDLVITKHRYSGFDHTELELALRAKECSTVVLAGTQTNVCVRQTAFDAVSLGFSVAVVRDCVASTVRSLHEGALTDIAERAGEVIGLPDLCARWRDGDSSAGVSSFGEIRHL